MPNLQEAELKAIDKVQKLLALASNNPNEHEASAAAAKATEILELFNLDMAVIERHSGTTAKREDTRFNGGLYPWQRQLWNGVAELHFCKYWFIRGLRRGQSYQHRVLGRHENVVATQVLAGYLQQAIERLTREWAGDPAKYFTRAAVSYRDGMTARVLDRLQQQRREREAAHTKAQPRGDGRSLILADVAQAEADANNDFLYGAGWSAKTRAMSAKWAEEAREAERKQAEYDAAHPAEAAARKAKEAREAEKRQRQWDRGGSKKYQYKGDSNAYWQGHDKGADIGLDQQVDHNPTKRI